MWRLVHTIETSAKPEAIWQRWTDVESWPEWDEAIKAAQIKGKFSQLSLGSKAILHYARGTSLKFRVVEQVYGRILVCRGWRLGLSYCLEHYLQPTHLGSKITHCLVVHGPLAWLLRLTLGRQLKETMPRAARKLAQIA